MMNKKITEIICNQYKEILRLAKENDTPICTDSGVELVYNATYDKEKEAILLDNLFDFRILDTLFIKQLEEIFVEGVEFTYVKHQIRSLWTAYCIYVNLEVDTLVYDDKIRDIFYTYVEKSINPPSLEGFDMFMCEYLV